MSVSAGICATDGCVVRSETGHNVVLVRPTAIKIGSIVLLEVRGVL